MSVHSADSAFGEAFMPPHSIEAEQSVLGGLLMDNDAWDRVADAVTVDDFYRGDHRQIFHHIGKLIEARQPADVVTVFESLRRAHEDTDKGALTYLNSLAQNTPSAANIRRYAELVRERATLRRLIAVSDEIGAVARNPNGRDTREILDEAESKLFKIAEEGAKSHQTIKSMDQVVPQVLERLQQLYERNDPNGITGVPTGFVDLDRMTSGLQPGDLVIVAGRPSMGKTAFALNIAEHVAIDRGLPVVVFSMEMGASQLALRTLGSVGRIDQQRMRSGRLLREDWTQLTSAVQQVHSAPLHIDESPGLNAIELRARARRLARTHKRLGLIIVDYLQLMTAAAQAEGRQFENRATVIAEISRSLKALAKELAVPVVALSQLNRQVDQRLDRRPVMSDLRESGAIEQDADVIFFIHREEQYNAETTEKGIAEVIVGKQRNGPTGTVKLRFAGEFTRFDNLAHTN